MNTNDSYLVGSAASFTDHSGATVTYFRRARRVEGGGWMDLTAYKRKGMATRAVNKLNAKSLSNDCGPGGYFVLSLAEYRANLSIHDPICKTRNMLNPKAGYVDIRASEFGGCCDVGTERYHCM